MVDTASSSPEDWHYPYGSPARYPLQHTHLFASDIASTIAFYRTWFDAEVVWEGVYAEARNVFMKIGDPCQFKQARKAPY